MSAPVLVQLICLAALMALLVRMAIGDLRAFIIPNQLNLAVAGLGLVYVLASAAGGDVGTELAWRAVQALAVGALFAVLFALGWMGGGDVKLMAALALWLPLPELAELLIYSSLFGGLLGLIAAVRRRRQATSLNSVETLPPAEIPYGIAIACGAMIPAGELFFKTAVPLLAG